MKSFQGRVASKPPLAPLTCASALSGRHPPAGLERWDFPGVLLFILGS